MTLPFNIGIFVSATQGALNRLDWFELGAGSISKTAAFIVMLMVASWGLIALRKTFYILDSTSGKLHIGIFFDSNIFKGGVCCISNCFFSFIILSPMRISMTKSIVVVIAVICGVLFSNVVGFTDRMGKMICLESSSANVRYDLYSAGLKNVD